MVNVQTHESIKQQGVSVFALDERNFFWHYTHIDVMEVFWQYRHHSQAVVKTFAPLKYEQVLS